MKILVSGSRHLTLADYPEILEVFKRFHQEFKFTSLVEGEAGGLDTLAKRAFKELGITDIRPYRAQWEKYGRAAGPYRNQDMLDKEHKPEEPIGHLFAFPCQHSVGTHDMIRRVGSQTSIPTVVHAIKCKPKRPVKVKL